MRWQKENETRPPLAYIAQTRRGHGYSKEPDASIGLLVDFEGPVFKKIAPDAPIESVATVDGNGALIENHVYRNEVTGGWRLRLRVNRLDAGKPVELRAFLRSGANVLTSTWSYILPPE